MSPLGGTTVGLAVVGDDLATCVIRHSTFGAERRDGPTIRRFLTGTGEEAARQLTEVISAGARVVLMLPGSACAVRPIALTTRTWNKARAEMQRAVPSLFPLSSDDALLAVIDAAPKDGEEATGSGWLVATSRSRLDPWRAAIERVIGRSIDECIPFHVAAASLGLQHDAEATLIEPLRTGGARAHRFRYARPVELSQPAEVDNPDPNDWTSGRLITITDSPAAPADGDAVRPADLAAAAASARSLAREGAVASYVPFIGAPASSRSRLVMPIAGFGVAAAIFVLAAVLGNARLARATERVDTARQANAARVKAAELDRAEYERLASRIRSYADLAPDAAPRLLPILASAQSAVPSDAFLYRIDLDQRSVTIRGEAPRTLDVLARLEATDQFKSAESLEPPSVIKERSLETFNIRAQRADVPARAKETPR